MWRLPGGAGRRSRRRRGGGVGIGRIWMGCGRSRCIWWCCSTRGASRFSGGYVGVDVFFVLSGFLVTQLLLRDLEPDAGRSGSGGSTPAGSGGCCPAAFVTLIVTAMVFTAIASPVEVLDAAGGFKAAFLYVTNWYFIPKQPDYFGANITSNPVLHFWSLAVEEQFYLLWPLAARRPVRHHPPLRYPPTARVHRRHRRRRRRRLAGVGAGPSKAPTPTGPTTAPTPAPTSSSPAPCSPSSPTVIARLARHRTAARGSPPPPSPPSSSWPPPGPASTPSQRGTARHRHHRRAHRRPRSHRRRPRQTSPVRRRASSTSARSPTAPTCGTGPSSSSSPAPSTPAPSPPSPSPSSSPPPSPPSATNSSNTPSASPPSSTATAAPSSPSASPPASSPPSSSSPPSPTPPPPPPPSPAKTSPPPASPPSPPGLDWQRHQDRPRPKLTNCYGKPATDCTLVHGTGPHILLIGDSHAGMLIPALTDHRQHRHTSPSRSSDAMWLPLATQSLRDADTPSSARRHRPTSASGSRTTPTTGSSPNSTPTSSSP